MLVAQYWFEEGPSEMIGESSLDVDIGQISISRHGVTELYLPFRFRSNSQGSWMDGDGNGYRIASNVLQFNLLFILITELR